MPYRDGAENDGQENRAGDQAHEPETPQRSKLVFPQASSWRLQRRPRRDQRVPAEEEHENESAADEQGRPGHQHLGVHRAIAGAVEPEPVNVEALARVEDDEQQNQRNCEDDPALLVAERPELQPTTPDPKRRRWRTEIPLVATAVPPKAHELAGDARPGDPAL